MVLPLIIAVVLIAALVAALVLFLGGGDRRRGRLRLVRRIRSLRRRRLWSLLRRLGRGLGMASQRPGRRSVATQLRRVAQRLEGAHRAGRDFESAQRELAQGVERVRQVVEARSLRSESARRPGTPAGVTTAGLVLGLLIGMAALALAAGNAWLLVRWVTPVVGRVAWFPFTVPAGPVPGAGLAALPLFLGLGYYALLSMRQIGGRVLLVLAALVILGLGVLEGGAAVAALNAHGLVAFDWWGAMAVAALLGVAAGLVPPVTAVTAHAAVDRLHGWYLGRERRASARVATAQYRAANDLPGVLERMERSLGVVQAELSALAMAGAGRLLLHPGEEASVERAVRVLRRLAAEVEEDYDAPGEPRAGAETPAYLLRDLAALGAWGLATSAALLLSLTAVATGIPAGVPTALIALLITLVGLLGMGGLVMRWVVSRTLGAEEPVVRAATVLVWAFAAACAGAALGPLTATGPYFRGSALTAGATLTLFILVAGTASIRLPESVTAAATVVYLIVAGALWLLLRLFDLALAALDAVLVGFRRRPSRRRARPERPRTPVSALGSGHGPS